MFQLPPFGNMALQKYVPQDDAPSVGMKPLHISSKAQGNADIVDSVSKRLKAPYVNIDLTEVYFLIMHFLSAGPCQRTCGQLWNELLEHQLLPRRYHGWYSRSGKNSGDENDDGISFPLNYSQLVERYPHVEKDHLVQLLTQLLINKVHRPGFIEDCEVPNAAHVPTILGRGSFSLLGDDDQTRVREKHPPAHMRWPHMRADQVHGLSLREIGGGFPKHHRPPSIRAACYAIAKPSMVVHKMEHVKKLRGHRNAVYCATYDRSGRYVITGSDDRLVKIWSMETAFCLASCRGHEGDITDLAVSFNNAVVASASNDCVIRVWHVPDGMPVSVLRGHTAAVTAIAFCPRPGSLHQLLSSSDDGTCRLWDARDAHINPRIFVSRPTGISGKMDGASTSAGPQSQHQIFCCAFNSSGTVFVTGSSDNRARVWNACKATSEDSNQPTHEMDVLAGHENDVNYVQFSGCAVASRVSLTDGTKEESVYKFRNLWFSHENIVTCSRDGSATIFTPRSRRSHGKAHWVKQFHLKVPPPPMPPQPPRGPRQRILPTPRGVNMIIWSLDNRFVLAAIMDNRICVWNAADGEVVHTLTGHTASTYVLDVHPLNPRIAMSAGYDGKTIVWDIWEGQPIRIYEISPYKLVDGKFSPDGTSIILSDDVGQLHFLSTGQGESQKDAQYDQFFLGDYRPLIQDSSGHVLDQETQLAPYRRNMLDLLCNSGMIPYEEPYQSMYQRRRLGALGLEWNPSSLKLAAGPNFSLDPEYQLMPLGDLDFFVEPLPEFVDAMEWEPDIDVRSDDTDSEYNVTDGYSSAAEHGSFEFCSSDDPECSADDNEVKEKDGSRRSKRKKQKSEIEVTTSSGRRAKKRNLDESDGNPLKSNRSKNLRVGRRGLKKKYSKSKSSRPRRAAARNALNMFSKITEIATDEEEDDDDDGSESDFSETESSLPDSYVESDGMDESVQKERHRHLKGKEISAENSQSMINATELPNSYAGSRKRIILKLSSKFGICQSALDKDDNGVDNVGSSFKASQPESDANGAPTGFQMRGHWGDESRNTSEDEGRYLNLQGLSKGYHNGDIKWGGGKVRSSKRQKLGEGMTSAPYSRSTLCLKDPMEAVGQLEDGLQREKDHPSMAYILEGKQNLHMADEVATEDGTNLAHGNFDVKNDVVGAKRVQGLNGDIDFDQSTNLDQMVDQNYGENATKGDIPPVPTRFRIRARNITKDSLENQTCDASFSNTREKIMGVNEHDMSNGHSLEREGNVFGELFGKVKGNVSHPNGVSGSNSNPKRMYSVVYRRSKQSRGKANWERDADGRESTSSASACNHNISSKNMLSEVMKNEASGPHSASFSVPACGHEAPQNGSSESQEMTEVDDECVNASNFLESSRQPREEGGSSSRIAVRSSRRRTSYRPRDLVPVDPEKSNRQGKAGSWFMLPAHVEGSHYIPQLGDEVAYLRQGHQEYLEFSGSKEAIPWRFVKGNVRAVEFCKVVKLEYDTLAGSGDRCCKMTLQFVDPTSSMLGKNFKLTLPEVTGFPDFLVERSRFDTAMQRDWACRDKCKVWWESAGEEAKGGWWDGRIKSIEPKSFEFPDSPWERYTLSYKSDPKENHKHSPWELFDDNDESGLAQPHLDDETKKKLQAALVKLEQSGNKSADYYGVQHLRQVSQKPNFANRFPVPLTVDVILSRVKNDYYRSVEAVRHDIEVMVSNVVSYSSKSAVLAKVQRMSDLLAETLNSL